MIKNSHTMNPVMFCRKTKGMPRCVHNSIKWAPFRADSLNNTPLFPMMPTGFPKIFAKPVTRVCKEKPTKMFD